MVTTILEYVNIISKMKSENTEIVENSRRDRYSNQEQLNTPSRLDQIESDGLRDINEGTQHGWLASQNHTENDSPVISHSNKG